MSKLINRIMQGLENGMNEKDIKSNVGGSNRLIAKCKREFDTRNNIGMLIKIGRFNEAQRFADELELKSLDKDTLFVLLELAIKIKDIEREREILKILQYRQLNYKEQKRALYLALELEPDNIEYLDELIKIARKEEDYEQLKILTDKRRNLKRSKLHRRRQKMFNQIKLEEFKNEGIAIGNLETARMLIYESTDIPETLEKIAKMLDGEDEITKVLIKAEFLSHTGFAKRAEILLKGYMKNLDANSQMQEIKSVKQAIELAKSSKTMPHNWKEFWSGRGKIPSAIGEEPEGR